jgi:hypothetical protein
MTEQQAQNFTHDRDHYADWQGSPERVVLFTVTKTDPNPEAEGLETNEHGALYRDGVLIPKTIERVIEYTMPKRPNAGLALEYLKRARRTDPDQAMSWLIEAAVGVDGYDALADELANPDVVDPLAVLRDLVGRIQKVALGGLEAPKAPTS